MISALVLAAAIAGNPEDLLAQAVARYQAVESYQLTLHSSHADGEEHLRYHYRRPGFVRMEFIRPHAGAVLIYSPETQRVRLWPFGAGRFPELNLNPANRLIKSPRGQRVDQSDVGALFDNVLALQRNGRLQFLGETTLDGIRMLHLSVSGSDRASVSDVHAYELWLDTANLFPQQVISRDMRGIIIETVRMQEVSINPPQPPDLFAPPD